MQKSAKLTFCIWAWFALFSNSVKSTFLPLTSFSIAAVYLESKWAFLWKNPTDDHNYRKENKMKQLYNSALYMTKEAHLVFRSIETSHKDICYVFSDSTSFEGFFDLVKTETQKYNQLRGIKSYDKKRGNQLHTCLEPE